MVINYVRFRFILSPFDVDETLKLTLYTRMFLKSCSVRERLKMKHKGNAARKLFIIRKVFMSDIEFKEGHFCKLELINKFCLSSTLGSSGCMWESSAPKTFPPKKETKSFSWMCHARFHYIFLFSQHFSSAKCLK